MILGGNLIGGWAHARDLMYVSNLVRAYHHRDKIFETLALAESCGVNAIITNPLLCEVINEYWRNGGRIKFISDCGGKDVLEMIQKSIDRGACACYIQGGVADRLVEEGKFDLMAQGLDLVRKNRLPPASADTSWLPSKPRWRRPEADFWMKLHRVDYWSAATLPETNIWCESPTETAAYRRASRPWIAQIPAAGAIKPEVASSSPSSMGGLHLRRHVRFPDCGHVNLARDVLNGNLIRERRWCAEKTRLIAVLRSSPPRFSVKAAATTRGADSSAPARKTVPVGRQRLPDHGRRQWELREPSNWTAGYFRISADVRKTKIRFAQAGAAGLSRSAS
jgi:hypothetical protein